MTTKTRTSRRRKTPPEPHVTGADVERVARTGAPHVVPGTGWELTIEWLMREVPAPEWLPGFLSLPIENAEAVAFRLNREQPWVS